MQHECLLHFLALTIVLGISGSASAQCEANESAKLIASDGSMRDHFGRSVAIGGDVAFIGATGHVHEDGAGSGSVYISHFDGSAWTEETELLASDGVSGDAFGFAIGLSGNVLVVSAPYDDDNAENAGSAYVFRLMGGTWVEEAKLAASVPLPVELFGWSVAISDDVVIVGTRHEVSDPLHGAAYIYRYDGSTWAEEGRLVPADAAPGDAFGWSVAISGDVAVISAPADDDNGESSGSVYIYQYDGSTWYEADKLLASDGAIDDNFGIAVAFDGNAALIGAHLDDDNGGGSGSAYVFRFDGATWNEEAKLLAWDGDSVDMFGRPLAINGNVAVIGAKSDEDNGSLSGSAYVFRFDSSEWIGEAKILPSDGHSGDEFPHFVALSDDRLIAGKMFDDVHGLNSGSAYFFHGLGDCNNNGTLDICDIADGTSPDTNGNGVPDECEIRKLLLDLDIKPGSCPNPLNRHGNGVLPVALVGTVEVDPNEVDLSTLQLSRADGVGGSVAPNEGPPGPHSVLEDVATPFEGKLCDCHELEGDGILDLSMKFRTDDVVAALLLNDLPAGDLVELVVSGTLLDGTSFTASDCIRLVPPGAMAVGSPTSSGRSH